MYAKLENGMLNYPPKHLHKDGRYVANYNHHTQDLIADGYLEVVEAEQPEAKEGFYTSFRYEERDGKIIQSWEYKEITEEDSENI